MAQQQFEQKVVQSSCPYCGVGCGVNVTTVNGQATELEGANTHPANIGKLCVKGSNLLQTLDLDGRLLTPQVHGENVEWDKATELVANSFNHYIEQYGPDSVAFYVSGQILTEDYYVANKLMKGYIGSANIDTNSRLCMSSAVAAYKRAFGSDTVPCNYEDLEQAELIVFIGSNAAWTHPVLFQRMEQAKAKNPNVKFVVIDPRQSATSAFADLFLPIKPGSDVALFNGLIHYLAQNQYVDDDFINEFCNNWDEVKSHVEQWSIVQVAQATELTEQQIESFYQTFADTKKVISFYSQGVNQSSQGVDKCNAIINCHLATGRIGQPGMGPFSITGQPNAMGGREVGGLANMLAAHMNIEDAQHRELVQEFWDSPTICTQQGAKAVDMFEKMRNGQIKAVWIMATNPMVSLPNRQLIEDALNQCEFVVVSDCVARNDTMKFADVKLPATTWGEKFGTVTNSERRISRQRAFLPPPGEARHDWDIMSEVATKMGFGEHFDYQHPVQIFNEHAALSGYKNHSDQVLRDFDISGLAGLTQAQYDRLKPVQWPVNKGHPYGTSRMFADNQFFTASRKAQFVVTEAKAPLQQTNDDFPFVLNTGRIRDQWHTMTRTGKSANLNKNDKEPCLSIGSDDAESLQLSESQLVKVNARTGSVILPVRIESTMRKGQVFAPIHWSEQTAKVANVTNCFDSSVDPLSGQPESKHGAVALEPIPTQQFGQVFTRQEITPNVLYWAKVQLQAGYEYILADQDFIRDPLAWCQSELPVTGQWQTFHSSKANVTVVACFNEQRLETVAFFGKQKLNVHADWVNDLLAEETLSEGQVSDLLMLNVDEEYLKGKTICSCFKVGENQIVDAIKDGQDSVEALGESLKCGTNCGSCKSELRTLIDEHQSPKANRFDTDTIIKTENSYAC